jgi:glycosyltransferase involved in cell wall biosynthesis
LYRPDLEFTRVTNPSKIRDYLASTRPIVSTAIPDVVKLYSGFLRIGYSPEEYVGHVRDLISMPRTDGSGEERLRFARDHTWPRVADELWRLLESARSRRPVTAS